MNRLLHNHRSTLFWAVVVFVLTVLFRLPSCYESFWVDELHTAWCIWGDWGQVAERAEVGNQTPLYFYMMWFWKALVGESELGLRMSSVLAVALGSSLLVVGVRHTTRSLAAGVLAGLILVIESNSIWFGTEFRPYAFVMLLSVIATWAAVCLLGPESTIRRANLRLVFVVSAGLATLLHPTALMSLGLLLLAVVVVAFFQQGFKFQLQILDCISLIVIAAITFTLMNSTLGESWENRSRWAAFGKAKELGELWAKWPWLPLVVIPTLVGVVGWAGRLRTEIVRSHVPMLVGGIATALFFFASYFDWVPLWHRRYFIAVLPMLAWSAGACAMLSTSENPGSRSKQVAWVVVVLVAGVLFWQQGAWNQFQRTQTWGERRGEDWRRAVAWVNQQRGKEDWVYVDGDLIEKPQWTSSSAFSGWFDPAPSDRRFKSGYFEFPVSGPYLIEQVAFFSGTKYSSQWSRPSPDVWVISRNRLRRVESSLERYCDKRQQQVERYYFGKKIVVYVVRKVAISVPEM